MADAELVANLNEAFLAVSDIPSRSEAAQLFGPTSPVWVERRLCLQKLGQRLATAGDTALGETLREVDRTALERALVFAVGELNESGWGVE